MNAKRVQWVRNFFQQMLLEQFYFHIQNKQTNMNLDSYLTLYANINSKLMKSLNARAKTVFFFKEENMGANLEDLV